MLYHYNNNNNMIGAECEFLSESGWTNKPDGKVIAYNKDGAVGWKKVFRVIRDEGSLLEIGSDPFLHYLVSPDHPIPLKMQKGGLSKADLPNIRADKVKSAQKIWNKLQYQDSFTGEHTTGFQGNFDHDDRSDQAYLPLALAALSGGKILPNGTLVIDEKYESILEEMDEQPLYETDYDAEKLLLDYELNDYNQLLKMSYFQALYCIEKIEPAAYKRRNSSRYKIRHYTEHGDAIQWIYMLSNFPTERSIGQVEGQLKPPFICVRGNKITGKKLGQRISVDVENPIIRYQGRICVV